jgi:hypothetical protein
MTLTFCLSGSSGASVLPSFMAAPEPSALQWSSLMPFPRNITAKRLGNAEGDGVSASAWSDSSQGKAMVQPAPRRIARRVTANGDFRFDCGISSLSPRRRFSFPLESRCRFLLEIRIALIAKLRAGHDRFHQWLETVALGCQPIVHLLDQWRIG